MNAYFRAVGVLTLAAFGIVGTSRAELNLPDKVVVVRDFSRKRQDLLDSLKVNLPDATVKIQQFRGAEVVLHVKVPKAKAGDPRKAREALRRHCDKVIRRAYPGMKLSDSSRFSFVKQASRPLKVSSKREKVALIQRLKSALVDMEKSPVQASAASLAPKAPTKEPSGALSAADKAEKNGYLASLRSSTRARYEKLLARTKKGASSSSAEVSSKALVLPGGSKSLPLPVIPKVQTPPQLALSAKTTERMGRYPAVPASARAFTSRTSSGSSLSTVQGIYKNIFEDRESSKQEAKFAIPDKLVDPRKNSPHFKAASSKKKSESPPALARASRKKKAKRAPSASKMQAEDSALSHKIAALFDSVKRAEATSR